MEQEGQEQYFIRFTHSPQIMSKNLHTKPHIRYSAYLIQGKLQYRSAVQIHVSVRCPSSMLADAPYVCVYNYNVRNIQTVQLYTYCNSLQCSLALHKTVDMFAAGMQCMYMPHHALHVCMYTCIYGEASMSRYAIMVLCKLLTCMRLTKRTSISNFSQLSIESQELHTAYSMYKSIPNAAHSWGSGNADWQQLQGSSAGAWINTLEMLRSLPDSL